MRTSTICPLSGWGPFDVVLFLGLLYHLPDPLEALLLLRSLCRDRLCVESQVIDQALLMSDGRMAALADVAPALVDVPLMQFYPGRSLNNDPTNYWAPNLSGLQAMLRECNFTVKSSHLLGARAIANCVIREDAQQDTSTALRAGYHRDPEGSTLKTLRRGITSRCQRCASVAALLSVVP